MNRLKDIKEKLRKLVAHQKSADEIGNEEEAAAFGMKVQELLLTYQLEMEDLQEHVVESVMIGEEYVDCHGLTMGNEGKWVMSLFGAVSRSNSCTMLIASSYTNKLRILIIGHEINREGVKYIVQELVPRIRHAARYCFKSYNGLEKRNTFIRGFLMGACMTIRERLWDDYTRLEYEHAGLRDIVLNKQAAMDTYMALHYPRLGTSKGTSLKSRDGLNAGAETGRQIGINKTVGRGGNRLLE